MSSLTRTQPEGRTRGRDADAAAGRKRGREVGPALDYAGHALEVRRGIGLVARARGDVVLAVGLELGHVEDKDVFAPIAADRAGIVGVEVQDVHTLGDEVGVGQWLGRLEVGGGGSAHAGPVCNSGSTRLEFLNSQQNSVLRVVPENLHAHRMCAHIRSAERTVRAGFETMPPPRRGILPSNRLACPQSRTPARGGRALTSVACASLHDGKRRGRVGSSGRQHVPV